MAEFRPTAAQSAAITARGSTVLVSAGAGSGKTKVLTERLMGYITDEQRPADLDSFLIITFTRAAAGELRGRIMDELAARLAREPGSRRLRRQSALCQRAQIGTIHSFCAALLRENSHLAQISPDFKIADDDRAQAMKAAALERVLEARYAAGADNADFLLLADTAGAGRDDSRLAALVLSLHEKMQCHARPEDWAAKQVALLSAEAQDAGDTPWGREILSAAADNARYWSAELDALMAAMAGNEKISKAYLPSVSESAAQIRELVRCLEAGWDSARACLPVEFPRLGALRNSPDAQLSDRIKLRRDACKKAMAAIEAALGAPSEKLVGDMRRTSPAMRALLTLTLDFDAEYSRAKRRAGLVDYSDLEHMTAKLLTLPDGSPSELAARLSARYTEVMVDEYQDVSQVQDAIFKAVSNEGQKLFLVGDVKQSIYRFRLADPEIFTQKYVTFADAENAAPGAPRRIILQENFRSRREILDCANAVFSACMSRRLGDIDYDAAAELKYGARYDGDAPVPELLLLETGGAQDDDAERPDKTALEARLVGREILRLMSSGMRVGERPLEYGDITLLMRSANSVGGIYRRELAAMGIPVAAGQGGGFFDSVEISGVVSLLAVTDNPHQDIPLIAVLRSPAFGFTAEELAQIRAADKDGDFYTALNCRAKEDERCRAFLEKLARLRALAPDLTAAELVWQIIDGLDLLAVCSAMADGAARRANLLELLELSKRFDATGYRGLHRFVLWLRQLNERGEEPPSGASGGAAVQIMTVHKSKGLEFPVVFLCDTARRFNRQDSRDTVLVHPQLGLGAKVTDAARRIEYPSLARNAIRLRLEREMLSEEMRLLYVALTRPRERLYITAAVKDPQQLIEKSSAAVTRPMASEVLAAASAPVNWLIYAALADGERHLKMRICTPGAAPGAEEEAPVEIPPDTDAAQELAHALSFTYAHADASALPSKITATELKGRAAPDEDAQTILPRRERQFALPDFARAGRPVTGAERGVATHLALQCMDFEKTGTRAEIEEEIARLREQRFLSEREAAAVDAAAIYALFASPLGRRMRQADAVHREFKFSLLCPAEDVFGTAAGEELLLQGVVDCCIEENGRLCIIDYKTDAVRTDADIAQRSAYYTGQLRAYAAALTRIFGMEVSDCVLYFLAAGKTVKIAQKDLH